MKREAPLKPPPLPVSGSRAGPIYSDAAAVKGKSCSRFTGYDSYQGILKRVSDMKLNGSLDSEEPSTESEKSECSSCHKRQSKRHNYWSEENSGNGSTYEDESSGSSFGGSDHCPPYEEIPTEVGRRYLRLSGVQGSQEENYMNLPSPPHFINEREPSIRSRRSSSSSQYKNTAIMKHHGESDSKRSSMYSNYDKEYCNGEVCLQQEPSGEHPGERITDAEKHQIETFFRGLRTDLFVSSSLANLYVGWKDVEGKWAFKHTGIPVVILDRGETKSRNKKRIQIMLAERGTCFPLWKDTIDNLTSYRKAGEAFHTMHLSSDHRQIIGLSFDDSEESDHFFDYINELTSNPENINISVPGSKKSKKSANKKPVALPQKDQISNPCLFEHVTSVAAKDKPMYMSLQTLLDKELMEDAEADCCHSPNNWR